jgi:hypothetical protein
MECYHYNQLRIITRIHAIDIQITHCFLSIAAGSISFYIYNSYYIFQHAPSIITYLS